MAMVAFLQRSWGLLRLALLLVMPCCSRWRWEQRLAARVRVHGGAGRAARSPPLDGNVAYVDGSVAADSAMGAGIFYGVAHPLNRSVCLRQWWRCDSDGLPDAEEGRGDPNLAELGAVFLALLFHPAHQPLTLCTDSMFTLQQLQWLTDQPDGHGAGRARVGAGPPSGWRHPRFAAVLEAIAWLAYLREGAVVLHKVQAHSSRHRHAAGNAMADALAVRATQSATTAAEYGREPALQFTLPLASARAKASQCCSGSGAHATTGSVCTVLRSWHRHCGERFRYPGVKRLGLWSDGLCCGCTRRRLRLRWARRSDSDA
jgi:ribonuclease HI